LGTLLLFSSSRLGLTIVMRSSNVPKGLLALSFSRSECRIGARPDPTLSDQG